MPARFAHTFRFPPKPNSAGYIHLRSGCTRICVSLSQLWVQPKLLSVWAMIWVSHLHCHFRSTACKTVDGRYAEYLRTYEVLFSIKKACSGYCYLGITWGSLLDHLRTTWRPLLASLGDHAHRPTTPINSNRHQSTKKPQDLPTHSAFCIQLTVSR